MIRARIRDPESSWKGALGIHMCYFWQMMKDTDILFVICHNFLTKARRLLNGFMNDLPMSLEEAALVDGCNRRTAFFKIVMPILGPSLVATGVYIFMTSWNEYTFAVMFTNNSSRTIPVALKSLIGQLGVDWGLMTAGGIITIIPVCIMFFFAQKRLVEGLTAGAVKG